MIAEQTSALAPSGANGTDDVRYTLANARHYDWGSISGHLNTERVECLHRYLVGPTILDAGCGGGAYVNFLADKGFDVTGIDAHDDFLHFANRKHFRGTYAKADLNGVLPFADKSFDSTICFDVLEHINDRNAISELVRITRHLLIVGVPLMDTRSDKYSLTYYPYLDPTHLRYYTEASLAALFESVGAKVINMRRTDRVPLEYLVAKEFRVQSKWPLLAHVYKRMLSFLLARTCVPEWHINLLAVVDLAA